MSALVPSAWTNVTATSNGPMASKPIAWIRTTSAQRISCAGWVSDGGGSTQSGGARSLITLCDQRHAVEDASLRQRPERYPLAVLYKDPLPVNDRVGPGRCVGDLVFGHLGILLAGL